MLRCRMHQTAPRRLFFAFNTLACRGWQRGGFGTVPAATNKKWASEDSLASSRGFTRRSRGKSRAAIDGDGSHVHSQRGGGTSRKARQSRKVVTLDKAESMNPELRRWKMAMLELAGRYSGEVDPENLDKISLSTSRAVPDVLTCWKEVMEGDNGLWFRGAAKFYALLLAGVWPRMANCFLSDLMKACKDGDTRLQRQREPTTSANSTSAVAVADGLSDLDWKRGLNILREANRAGVKLSQEVMVILLSRVPPGNSRKISRVVTAELYPLYGLEASSDMLAIAAVAHWRAGVVAGACRLLDMKEIPTSLSPLVQNWLAKETRHVYAASRSAYSGASRPRRWTWQLVVVDIYGRAGRWTEAADAFDAFVVESFGSATSRNPTLGRLPLPEEPGGELMTADGVAAAAELWASVHPSPLAHAVGAYIKLNKVDGAAWTLLFLRTSLSADFARAVADVDIAVSPADNEDEGDDFGGGEKRPLGPPDPAWVANAVRGFARLGRWGLITEVLSPEICDWASDDSGPEGNKRVEAFQLALDSLKSFLEHKSRVKRPAPGQIDGAKACLKAMEGIRGNLQDRTVVERDAQCRSTAEIPKEDVKDVKERRGQEKEGATGFGRLPESATVMATATLYPRQGDLESDRDADLPPIEDSDDDAARSVGDQEQRAIYAEALQWLMVVRGTEGHVRKPGGEMIPLMPLSDAWSQDWAGADVASIARLLRLRAANLEQETVLEAVRQAWVEDSVEGHEADRRRSAAFALYEAGLEAGVLTEDLHWTSPTAGVVDLHCGDYRKNRAVPLAALHLVLTDMLRKHAFEEEVARHVHHPHADLVMIAGTVTSGAAVNTTKGVLWLLRDRFGEALAGPEILPPLASPVWEGVEQVSETSRRGIVLCLPRRRLQRWLLMEGRAWKVRCGRSVAGGGSGNYGSLWSPSWVEDGIDAMPPMLPGRGGGDIFSVSRVCSSGGGADGDQVGLPNNSRSGSVFPSPSRRLGMGMVSLGYTAQEMR